MKTSITPWDYKELDSREATLAALVNKGIRKMLKATAASLADKPLTSAAEPATPVPPPDPAAMAAAQAAAVSSWQIFVTTELAPFVEDTFMTGAELTVEALYEALGVEIPKVVNEYATDYLASVYNRMVGISDTVWQGIQKELLEGYAAGEGIPQLAARLTQFGKVNEYRATMVARTEVISAANAGSYVQVLDADLGVKTTKQWIATDDHRTRVSHEHADDDTVDLTSTFSVEIWKGDVLVGHDHMEFPGDPTATPGNVINCRCTLGFEFEEDEEQVMAASAFKEALHPRDNDGKFAKKPGLPYFPDLSKLTDNQVSSFVNGLTPNTWGKMSPEQKQAIVSRASTIKKESTHTKLASLVGKEAAKAEVDHPTDATPPKAAASAPATGGVKGEYIPGVDKKTGKTVQPDKPVKLRVKALFETDYQDGAIVAVHDDGKRRIVWNADSNKMEIQTNDGSGWKTSESLTRGALMAKSKDEEGWKTPPLNAPADTGDSVLNEIINNVGKTTAGGKPIMLRVNVLYNTKYNKGDVVAHNVGSNERLIWNGSKLERQKRNEDGSWTTTEELTRGAAYAKYKNETGWTTPSDADFQSAPAPAVEATAAPKAPTPTPAKGVKGAPVVNPDTGKFDKPVKQYAEYNGQVYTRTSQSPYKYASVIVFPWQDKDAKGFVASWHRTEEGAKKGVLTGQQKKSGAYVKTVVPVTWNEPEALKKADHTPTPEPVIEPTPAEKWAKEIAANPIPTEGDSTELAVAKWDALPDGERPVLFFGGMVPDLSKLTKGNGCVGSHCGETYIDVNGDTYLVKTYPTKALAQIDVTTALLRTKVGLPTPATAMIKHNGQWASIQRFVKGADTPFKQSFNPVDLSDADVHTLQREQVFDWLISNHDSNFSNFVKNPNGQMFGIDKAQAWKYLATDTLSWDYKPNEHEPMYNKLWRAYANGEDVKLKDYTEKTLSEELSKIAAIPDSEFRDLLRPIAEDLKAKGLLGTGISYNYSKGQVAPKFPSNDVEAFLDAAVARKHSIGSDFMALKLKADNLRASKLMPPPPSMSAPVPAPPTPTLNNPKAPLTWTHKMLVGADSKNYKHGQVIATDPLNNTRLIWNAYSNKYAYQKNLSKPGENPYWITQQSYSKTAAWNALKGATGWEADPSLISVTAPHPVPGGLPKVSAPKVAKTPSAKLPKFTTDELVAQYGDVSHLLTYQKNGIRSWVKFGGPDAPYANSSLTYQSPAVKVFKRAVWAQKKWNEQHPDNKLSLLQIIKAADSSGYGNTYEKAVIDWLGTPSGKSSASKIINDIHNAPSGDAKAASDLAKAKSEFDTTTLNLSKPSTTTNGPFLSMNLTQYNQMFEDMGGHSVWANTSVKSAVQSYTGSGYVEMNSALREYAKGQTGGYVTPSALRKAARVQSAMRPATQDIFVVRGLDPQKSEFQIPHNVTIEELKKFVGKTFVDQAFVSTSTDKPFSGKLRLEIEAPKGTPMLLVRPISGSMGENEVLLAAKTKFKIHDVEIRNPGTWEEKIVLKVRVVP